MESIITNENYTKTYITSKKQVTELKVGDYLLHVCWDPKYYDVERDTYGAGSKKEELFMVTEITLRSEHQILDGSPIVFLFWMNPPRPKKTPNRAEVITRLDWYNYFHHTFGKSEDWYKLDNIQLTST